MEFNAQLFKKHLRDANIALPKHEVKGSLTYLDYGLKIRQKLYSLGTDLLARQGFEEIRLSDMSPLSEVAKLDKIAKVSQNYLQINGTPYVMSAGHEVPFYLFLKEYLKSETPHSFPLQFFHFGAVYRYPKNTKFPFSLGERRSFLECYIVYKDAEEGKFYLQAAINWNRDLIKNTLHIPSVEVERPLITNKPFSRKTICIDSITPLGATVITGMSYLHDDIFARIFEVKNKNRTTNKNKLVHAVHFGISDHLLFSYLLNSHDEKGFRMLSVLAPYHVSILTNSKTTHLNDKIKLILKYLDQEEISYEIKAINLEKQYVHLNQNTTKGIPVTLVFIEREGIECFTREEGRLEEFKLDSLNIIKEAIAKQDADIISTFAETQKTYIIECTNIEQVNRVISSGKVAKVYLGPDDESVLELESLITAGEILGFNRSEQNGSDIVRGRVTDSVAYISRRS